MGDATLSAYGLWHVTTEGDCEGRSIKDLGTHEGFLDEIALALAGSAEYGLRFSALDTASYKGRPAQTEVNVSLDIETRTWDMSGEQRVSFFRKMLEGRPVTVDRSDFHASVRLLSGRNPVEREAMRKEAARRTALSKLTAAEIEALGLK